MADTTTIVVLAALQQQAEQAAITADPVGGAGTFVPGVWLRRAGDTTNRPHALLAVWNMKPATATEPAQLSTFATALGGPVSIYKPGQSPHLNRDRWLFDSNIGWPLHEVLAALGMERVTAEE